MITARADQLIRRALGEEEEAPKQPTEFHFGLISPGGENHKRTRDFSLLFRRTQGDPATHTAIAREHGYKSDHHAVRKGWVRWHEDTHLDNRLSTSGDAKPRNYASGSPVDLKPTVDGKLHGVEFRWDNMDAVEHAFKHIAQHVPVGHTQVHVSAVKPAMNAEGLFTRGRQVRVPQAGFNSGYHTRQSALEDLASLHSHLHHENQGYDDGWSVDDFDDDDSDTHTHGDPYYEDLFKKHNVRL